MTHLIRYSVVAWLSVLATMSFLLPSQAWTDGYNLLFTLFSYSSYAALYLLPTTLLAWAAARWLHAFRAAAVLAIIGSASIVILLYADARILSMYGFHINGFVINLVLTPGGIDSLGGDAATQIGFAVIMAMVFVAQAALWWLCQQPWMQSWLTVTLFKRIVMVLLVFTVSERIMYGFAEVRARGETLSVAQTIPLYHPTRIRTLAKEWGFLVPQAQKLTVKQEGSLRYPLTELTINKPEKPYNIIWLVSESLRSDMLNADVMPSTWQFSQKGKRYTRHYSGGNGTRFGMFSLFTGLPGSYWFSFLEEERGAAIIDVVLAQNYQMHLSTAQSFTYPEFERTIFVRAPRESMHVDAEGNGHERDRRNISRLIDILEKRKTNEPFFAFNFFESPHARYYFDPDTAIKKEYLKDFNYARADVDSIRENIEGIHNRYINSVHALDETLTPLWTYLESHNLLENTIVIFTGDHGEEFMEKGRWGHNSEFTDEQIRVPLVLWLPGQVPTVDDRFSAHMDVTATLMPLLGVSNPSSDYSMGFDLTSAPARAYTLLADWERVGYVDKDVKIAIPMTASGFAQQTITTANDQPVDDANKVFQQKQLELMQAMRDISHFRRKKE